MWRRQVTKLRAYLRANPQLASVTRKLTVPTGAHHFIVILTVHRNGGVAFRFPDKNRAPTSEVAERWHTEATTQHEPKVNQNKIATTMGRTEMLTLRLAGLTYAQIAAKAGVSRQRVQQLLSPPIAVRRFVLERAKGCCQSCGLEVGESGHVHHTAANGNPEDYNDIPNLKLLCLSCHAIAHGTFARKE